MSATGTEHATEPQLARASRAVFLLFAATGVGLASWASRIPQSRDALGLTPSTLGVLLLAIALGSMTAMATSAFIVHRLGAGRAGFLTSFVFAGGLAVAGVGTVVGAPMVALGLFLLGYGNAATDVALNVEGAELEQQRGSALLSRFHAGFSVGTVLGALLAVGMNALGVSVAVHLTAVAAVLVVGMPLATRGFLPADGRRPTGGDGRTGLLRAWAEPRTLLIGLLAVSFAFSEGSGNDWSGVAAVDGHGASPAMASLAYGVFVGGMLIARWFGTRALDAYGRVAVLRASTTIAIVGVLVVVTSPGLAIGLLGTLLWGIGTGIGFPVTMSAAADDPARAASRVSVVAAISYLAFLSEPVLVGLAGDRVGVLRALSITAAVLALGLLTAGAARPLGTSTALPDPSTPRRERA